MIRVVITDESEYDKFQHNQPVVVEIGMPQNLGLVAQGQQVEISFKNIGKYQKACILQVRPINAHVVRLKVERLTTWHKRATTR